MTPGKLFSIYFKAIRIKKGFSQEDLAKASGLNRSTVAMAENCKSSMSVTNAAKVLTGLGLTFHDFQAYLDEYNKKEIIP